MHIFAKQNYSCTQFWEASVDLYSQKYCHINPGDTTLGLTAFVAINLPCTRIYRFSRHEVFELEGLLRYWYWIRAV